MHTIFSLPLDILRHYILSIRYLKPNDRFASGLVCRAFRGIVGKQELCVEEVGRDASLDFFQWADLATGCNWWAAVSHVAYRGNIGILEWLTEKVVMFPKYDAFLSAAEGGHIDTVQWLEYKYDVTRHTRWSTDAAAHAAKNGHIHVLEWLEDHKCQFDENVIGDAALNGHLETVKWLVREGCPTNTLCSRAALRGHLPILEYAVSIGCEMTTGTLECAAHAGNVEIMQYCYNRGCSVEGVRLCDAAVFNEQLDAFRWLIDRGCSLSTYSYTIMAKTGRLGMLKYVWEKRAPDHDAVPLICIEATCEGHLSVLQWISQAGLHIYNDASRIAAVNDRLHVLQWLFYKGFVGGTDRCLAAKPGSDTEAWLLKFDALNKNARKKMLRSLFE